MLNTNNQNKPSSYVLYLILPSDTLMSKYLRYLLYVMIKSNEIVRLIIHLYTTHTRIDIAFSIKFTVLRNDATHGDEKVECKPFRFRMR